MFGALVNELFRLSERQDGGNEHLGRDLHSMTPNCKSGASRVGFKGPRTLPCRRIRVPDSPLQVAGPWMYCGCTVAVSCFPLVEPPPYFLQNGLCDGKQKVGARLRGRLQLQFWWLHRSLASSLRSSCNYAVACHTSLTVLRDNTSF